MEYMKDGLLILPTHTWKTITSENPRYDRNVEPSCVGILTNLFMKRDGVIRSYHPTHSVAAYGSDAEQYIAGEEYARSRCPRNGCWGKLIDRKAKILFLGAPLRTNTFIHGVEEWLDIPNRLSDESTRFEIVMDDGNIITTDMYCHGAEIEPSQFYGKMKPVYMKREIATKGKIDDAVCYLLDAVGVYEWVKDIWCHRIDIFQDDKPIPTEWYDN
jgi:aminoglycoside 3-N-acetyltransferase